MNEYCIMLLVMAIYVSLAICYLVWNNRQNSKWMKITLKIAPIITLQCYVLSRILASRAEDCSLEEHSQVITLLIALLFSLIGDWLLVYQINPTCFVLAIIAFGVQQSLYIALFGFAIDGIFPIGMIVAIVSIMIYFYLLPKMKQFLVLPSAVYCVLIGCMLWRSLVRFHKYGGLMSATGAVMFYTSDSLLAVNKFCHRIKYGDVLIMVTYYTAQLFITVTNT